MTEVQTIPPDLAEAYAALGPSGIAKREGVDRHQVHRWLKQAGVILTGERRGNIAQRRPCPDDFGATYIRLGTDACVEHYHTRPETIRRWRDELGRDELKAARALHLATLAPVAEQTQVATSAPDPETELARAAAHWLRFRRAGGWVVSRRPDGIYTVGTMPMTAQQMIDFAGARGFTQELQSQYADAAMGAMG